MAEGKPSFFSSTLSGIAGSIKGALTGGGVGALLGMVAGAIIGAATGGLALPAIGLGALVGAQLVGIPMAFIGAISGSVTAVVTSREAAAPTANDVMGVAKMAYAQGLSTGLSQQQEVSKEAETTKWRDRHAQEQAAKAVAIAGGQTIH